MKEYHVIVIAGLVRSLLPAAAGQRLDGLLMVVVLKIFFFLIF